MKTIRTTAAQLLGAGRRLDASYHASDGVEALAFIRSWQGEFEGRGSRISGVGERVGTYGRRRVDRLDEVCLHGGIFIPSRFRRVFVDSRTHGAPYLTGGSVLQADPLQGAKFLSYRFTSGMDELRLRKRMVLVTCSGTIGNSVYVNANHEGSVGSPDLLRIVADPDRIPAGYLYVCLSGSLGKALIEQTTYGAVVPHIEAHHLLDLPIPRLDPDIELHIHELIERAAALRVEANARLASAQRAIDAVVGLDRPGLREHSYAVGATAIERVFGQRLDSFCYIGYVAEAVDAMKRASCRTLTAPEAGYTIYNPPLFKRMFATTGFPYMSGVEIYTLHPRTDRHLSVRQPGVEQYVVSEGMVLVQGAGQRYGLITTPVFVTKTLDGVAATSDIVRIVHSDPVENGYMCALLASAVGRRLALRYTYGSSIPRLNVPAFAEVRIPWPEAQFRRRVGRQVVEAYELRESANQLEQEAEHVLLSALEYAVPD